MIASNGYVHITYIDYGIEDYVVLLGGERCLIQYEDETAYFYYNNVRYDLGEFIRV